MLNDAGGFSQIYLATGYTDLRSGISRLASLIQNNFKLDPFQKNILFPFCGKRTNRIKGLVWEGDGFLLLYKKVDRGGYNWPRTTSEALSITGDQFRFLMEGFEVVARNPVKEVHPYDII